MSAKERGQWDSKEAQGETGFMEQARITVDGLAGTGARSVASNAMLSSQSRQRSLYGHSGGVNFAPSYVLTLADSGIPGQSTQTIGLKLVAGTGAARTINGSMQSLAETKRHASIVAFVVSNCTPIILNRLRIFLIYDLMLKTALRFVSGVIGIFMLHKMKKRLIRWTPYQVELGAMPSQALNESSLKV